MGIEALTSDVEGISVSSFNKYRWDANYSTIRLSDLPHRQLTKPAKVSEIFFDGEKRPRGSRDSLVKLQVLQSGIMNAIVFWFDLHLDESETLSNCPLLQSSDDTVTDQRKEEPSIEIDNSDEAADANTPAASCQENPTEVIANLSLDQKPDKNPEHHWGQALQYLDRMVAVEAGKKITILARREGPKLKFSLRQGMGEYVGKAPWKIEWGGGASVENPHFQRVHYCELLVRIVLTI